MKAEQIARVVHEANTALQIEQDDETIPVSPHWDELDDETKGSAIEGVKNVMRGTTPEGNHQSWCTYKFDHGWKLGPVKDEKKKEHPLLVPYDQLPPSQQVKDRLFINIVDALTVVSE